MKIPEKISLKTALIFLVISILLTSGLFYVFAANPSSPMYIGSGVYPGAPSYTIWKEGSNYFTRDANGMLPSWGGGTNFTDIYVNVEASLSALGGGRIFIKTGSYVGSIVITHSNIAVEGEGSSTNQPMQFDHDIGTDALYGTIIKPLEGKDGVLISGENRSGIQIRNLGIWFTTASTGDGITTDHGDYFNVEDLIIENIDVLHHNASHYAINLENFLETSVRNINSYGGGLLRLYANWDNFNSGDSIFENMYARILYDMPSDGETAVGFPIIIARNGTRGNCWVNDVVLDTILVNNPTSQSDSDFYGVVLWFARNMVFNHLHYEGVENGYSYQWVDIGSCHYITFNSPYFWTYTKGYLNSQYTNNKITWINAALLGETSILADGNETDLWINLDFYGTIDEETCARFINLKGYETGTSFPINPYTGQQFYRTDLYTFYIWNSTDWEATGEGEQGPVGPAGTLEGQQPYDYLVFINATSTYMINGTTGDIDFSGSPSSTINNALGNATGKVLLCSGTYTLTGDTGLTIDNNDVILQGMGYSTSLECESGFDDDVIHVTADYVTVCDLQIDGTNQAASYHGIVEDGNGNGGLFVHHVLIRDCGGDGIRLGDTDGSWEGNWGKIHHVVIKDNGEYGICFTYDATDSELVDFLISGHDGTGDAGINVGCDNIRITTGHLWGNEYEMKIAEDDYSGKGSVNGLIVSNVGFMDGCDQGSHRIYHASSKNFINAVFSGCEIWVAKLAGVDTYDGFYLAGDTWCVSITACVFRGDDEYDTQQGRYGIYMDASVHNCTIVSNTFEGFAQSDPIETTGASNLQEGYNVVYNCG